MRTMAVVAAATLTSVIAMAAPAAGASSAPLAPLAPLAVTWHSVEISAPLNATADPVVTMDAVACTGPGSCAGGGQYEAKPSAFEALVVEQVGGTWKRAQELSLPANAFARNPLAQVSSIACTGAGSCVGVGSYAYNNVDDNHAFIATESHGVWARAGQAKLPANAAGTASNAALDAVTCTGAGSCVAVGGYADKAGHQELMAATESKGHWGQAIEIAAPSNTGGANAFLNGVSCWRSGDCAAVGTYADKSVRVEALATLETNGHWAQATEIGLPANAGPQPGALLTGVGCSSATSCSAVGGYFDKAASAHAMVTTRSSHGWARATEIKAPPEKGFEAPFLDAISCVAAGTCESVGSYLFNFAAVPMAVTRLAGTWQPAANVASPANALTGMFRDATLLSIDCLKGGACTALGWFVDKSHHQQAMAATRPAP